MAVDDFITDIESSQGTNTELAVQPASGVEWAITAGLGSNSSNQNDSTWWFVAFDGQSENALRAGETTHGETAGNVGVVQGTLYMTNTEYHSIRNSNAGTKSVGFCGVQTK